MYVPFSFLINMMVITGRGREDDDDDDPSGPWVAFQGNSMPARELSGSAEDHEIEWLYPPQRDISFPGMQVKDLILFFVHKL